MSKPITFLYINIYRAAGERSRGQLVYGDPTTNFYTSLERVGVERMSCNFVRRVCTIVEE